MVAAFRLDGGFTLLDILQPCVSFNQRHTFKWYEERVKLAAEDHYPFDRTKALELSLKWDE